MRAFIATLLLAGVGAGVVASRDVDAQQPVKPIAVIQPESRFEFSMVTRWNQVLIGRFPEAEGDVLALPDGRRKVRIRLSTASVETFETLRPVSSPYAMPSRIAAASAGASRRGKSLTTKMRACLA